MQGIHADLRCHDAQQRAGQAQKHPTQDSPRNHEQDTDISPTMDTDSAVVENEVVQEEDSAVEELKDEALQNLMTYQDSMKCSYDKKLHVRAFKPGD
ncbi:hypothetical protein IFM89_038583 [Coptis chinensis]|uniref:Uncharacterized protein n=1 Tax=Coptis chinensis TaxID=261450 RepID=A0A835HHF3_9MAGN|nr:hypothetical protein IFM89_038583 [Coptis chinensis]